jgi:hypothetical protein
MGARETAKCLAAEIPYVTPITAPMIEHKHPANQYAISL